MHISKKKKKESTCNAGDTLFDSWVGKIRWRRNRLPIPVFLGFPCGSADKESACNMGNLGLIPGLGRSPRKGKGYPLQDSGLENSMDCIVHGVVKSQTWLSNFHFHFLIHEHEVFLHLFRSLTPFNNVLYFSLYKSCMTFVKWICMYFILFDLIVWYVFI